MRTKSRLFKIFAVALVAIFALACLIGFAACGDDECEHENVTKSEEESYDATCGKDGLTVEYCDDCGEKFETVIPATGEHVWDGGVVTKAATETEEGELTYTCTVCGATYTETIEKLKESEGLAYTLTTDKTGYIVSGVGDWAGTDLIIPAEHNGLPVVEIGNKAFSKCTSLTSVFIPASVTSIDKESFSYCPSLTTVTFEEDSECEVIKEGAFFVCSSLTSITIPDSVTTIEADTFSNCISLASITVPENITSMGSDTFGECTSLTEIHYNATNANSSSSSYSYYVFYKSGTGSDTTVTIGSNVESIPGSLFYYSFITSVAFEGESQCKTIGNSAFESCYTMTSIAIPDSIESIGDKAFDNCYSLTDVYYSGTEEEWTALQSNIGDDNSYLTSATIHFSSNGPEGGVEDAPNTEDSTGLTYTLNEDQTGYVVTGIGECTDRNVVIPTEYNDLPVVAIGAAAFEKCYTLKSVAIPDSVADIGESAFASCYSLANITIPDGVTAIGDGTFKGCCTLKSAIIPDGVTSIGDYAFDSCYSLTSIHIPDSVTDIGKYAFYWCFSLTSVNIPDNVTGIKDETFEGCSALTSMAIPSGVTSIGDYAFSWCVSLMSLTIPESVTSIGKGAFENCVLLTDMVIPYGVTSIEDYAFEYCASLTSIVIPYGVTSIGQDAFYGCSSLTDVVLPKTMESIANYAFSGCDSLEAVYYTGTPDEWTALQSNIGSNNTALTQAATIYCYSETKPADGGNWWHYDETTGEIVVWSKQS